MENHDQGKDSETVTIPVVEKVVGKKFQPKRTYKDKIAAQYRLDPIDHKIVEIYMENPLATIREVGALLDLTKKQVELRLRKPGVGKRLEDMRSSVQQLIQRAQILGVKRLMQLIVSRDEWISLQASKAILAPLLNVQRVDVSSTNKSIVYEVQVGPQGQVYQTARDCGDASTNPQGLPDAMSVAARLCDADAIG